MRKLIALLMVVFVGLFLLAEDKKYKVAVMEFDDQTKSLSAELLDSAAEYLRGALVASNQFIVISKDRQKKTLIKEEKKESWKECYDQQCRIELGQALSADTILTGTITRFGKSFIITLELMDLAKEATIRGAKSDFDGTEASLRMAIDATVAQICGKKRDTLFQEGKIGEKYEEWEVGQGEETIVRFESTPTEAVVIVDGRILCQKTPCSKMLTQGKHEIRIEKENYLPKTVVADVKKGDSASVVLEPDFGWLKIESDWTGIEIFLDGKSLGYTPVPILTLNPGPHQIEIKHPCFYQTGENFLLKRGETRNIILDLKSKESAIRVTAQDTEGNDLEAKIYVDGQEIGMTPGTFKVPVCSKSVMVKSDKGTFESALTLEEKKQSEVIATLKKLSGNRARYWAQENQSEKTAQQQETSATSLTGEDRASYRPYEWWGYGGLGAAAVMLAVGINYSIKTLDAVSAAKSAYDLYELYPSAVLWDSFSKKREMAHTNQNISIACYAVSGAFLVVGLTLVLWWEYEPESTSSVDFQTDGTSITLRY